MNQQINLFQPIFRQERKLLSLRTVLMALAIVSIALISIWGFSWRQVTRLAHDVDTVKHRLETQQEMVTSVSGQIAEQTTPEKVHANIKHLSALLADRSRALQLLRGGAAGSAVGFSARLEALARNRTDGLWLDHLSISGGSETTGGLLLEGHALDAQLLPIYLQQLANEPDLSGARFDQVVIDRYATHEAAEKAAQGKVPPGTLQGQLQSQELTNSGTTVRFSVASSRSVMRASASKEPRT
jgi:hypothetical protein